jgi:thiol-disulfide isomerase/thioredoxin
MTRAIASAVRVFGASLAAGIALALASAAFADQPANFIRHETPKPTPAIQFEDAQGRALSLADFKGKVVLLNIWATWCAPCRREMPALDRTQAALGGSDFEVVALSLDRPGAEVVRKFYGEVGIRSLAIYVDRSGKAGRELDVVGVPATILIDREGRELGRLIGPTEWDEHLAFLQRMISEGGGR